METIKAKTSSVGEPQMLWYSVMGVGTFLEYELPNDERWMTREQRQQWSELDAEARRHNTIVECFTTKRGT